MIGYNYYCEHERHLKALLDISGKVNCEFSVFVT